MRINVADVRRCLKSFDFKTLFREQLGWDNYQATLEIPVGGRTIPLSAIAEKRGFVAFVCDGSIPDRATRLKIDHQTTKSVREHLVIYADKGTGQQVWQWVRREQGKPLASRDHRFEVSQSGEPLIQRLDQIAVSLDEEEQITVVDVAGRARAAFDVDKITKRFYDCFKTEHTAFLNFVKGIKAEADLQWYTSLMLNRLMFIYFIQKKGFLDGDTDYLRNRLKRVQQARGKDKFQSFYRYFLLRLFHEGLGQSPEERRFDPVMEELLGKVPFLNGGFFEVHDLEKRYPEIDIPDEAFEKLFDFFDQYHWHLDERPLRADNEINPDVVGYIFEKYVNQKQMGAYYTKEDITEYISKNTVIPFIFDAAQKKCAIAFTPDSALWRLLRDNPDRYIYPAVRHGVIHEDGSLVPESELPDFVQTGMHDPKARMHENRYNLQQALAEDPIRLVTETWREYVYRRTRCLEVREKLQKGKVHQINDLITLNLDIWQLARDTIINAEGPELLRAFWQAIEKLTVLDPTCGSGAFLFAALRILETLYSDCMERMARFIEDLEGKPHHPKQYGDFKKVLAQIGKHPNERYFILKSIIINNLYGVDIMEEAVEICKLRLFLKLVAEVETAEQIEPLPDVDFNIRAGNTLVGFASLEQVKKSMEGDWIRLQSLPRIEEDAEIVEKAFSQFRALQTTPGGKVTCNDKQELRKRLAKLDEELDRYLAGEYGINVKYQKEFDAWKASHQPFHWFVEFYGIMSRGGFNIIIGNPPYVEYTKVRSDYAVLRDQYDTFDTGNLYSMVVERCMSLSHQSKSFGMILPLSAFCTQRMASLVKMVKCFRGNKLISHFGWRPATLFNGVNIPLSIVLLNSASTEGIWTTTFNKWYSEHRTKLFTSLNYISANDFLIIPFVIPKIGNLIEQSILRKMFSELKTVADYQTAQANNGATLYYRNTGGLYWRIITNFQPLFELDGKRRSSSTEATIAISKNNLNCITALLNSNLFWLHYVVFSSFHHVNPIDLISVPIDLVRMDQRQRTALVEANQELMEDLRHNSRIMLREHKGGNNSRAQTFFPSLSKEHVDKIDSILAKHYGLTEEELDYVVNFEVKLRLSSGNQEE